MDIPIMNTPDDRLAELGAHHAEQYRSNSPFPNIHLDGFFNEGFLNGVVEEFPDLASIADHRFNDVNQGKLATKGEYRLGPKAKQLVRFMNSQPFLDFLTNLTGIEHLLPDPTLAGGGYHEIKPGGFLKVHADFNKHPDYRLDRRLNVLVYLNRDWEEDFGGHFELWNTDMTACEKRILPIFNRMAIFSTTSRSYHGHPDPLRCPPDRSRRSIALYYYTNGRPQHEVEEFLEDHSTIFKARKGVDDEHSTEEYHILRMKRIRKQKQKEQILGFIRSLTPPVIYDTLRKLK